MNNQENEISFVDLLTVIWRRKLLIIIPTFICVVAAAIVSFLLPRLWEIDTIILPSKFLVQTEQGPYVEVVVTDPRQIAGQINQESYNSAIAAKLNLDLKYFPTLKAENLRDTNLVRISVRNKTIAEAKSILQVLFQQIKGELDKKIDVEIKSLDTEIAAKEYSIKDLENEIKTKENDIKTKNNEIKMKDLVIQSKEIDMETVKKEIESAQNKLKISEERVVSILEEMKSVKTRVDELEERLQKVIAEKMEGAEAVSLLLYSNEVQQNLRYYNTLDEKLSIEKVTRENLQLSINENKEKIRQIGTQIDQTNTEKEIIKTEISTIRNEIEKINNKIELYQGEIKLLADKKFRIDYAQMVKEPTSSLNPVSPKKLNITLITGLLSLMIFTMLALFIERLQRQKTPNK